VSGSIGQSGRAGEFSELIPLLLGHARGCRNKPALANSAGQ
jgi:hypothetical protein